jgi:hypothetical protein
MARLRNNRRRPRDRLFQKMSEVISLREKVAQAELAAHVLRTGIDMRDEVAVRKRKSNRANIGGKRKLKRDQ